jgi:type VI secretion system protein ImpK
MAKDDPFGLYAQSDRTVVIRPQPGGRPSAEPLRATPPDPPVAGFAVPLELPIASGRNPLLSAALPILSLAPLLRNPTPPADPDTLRTRLQGELDRYREAVRAAGCDPTAADQAAWALAALLDDIALNTPWGAASAWGRRSLVASIWSETDAGERFFEALARMQQQPGRHLQVLEVFHRCLAMGFEGRYRIVRASDGGVEAVRRSLARVLADLAGPQDPTLSPHWQGVAVSARPASTLVPPWVIGTATAALLLVVFTGFRYRLGDYTEQLAPLVAALPPTEASMLAQGRRATMPIAVAPDRTAMNPGFLAEEQRQKQVTVQESPQRVLIRLTARDLFAPGSDQLGTGYRALIGRIGQALADRPGRILVTGHTDNVPLRRSPRFTSNQELSEARAASVGALLAGALGGGERLVVAGKGEREPIADNATADGRARNRRVDIVLYKVAGG